MKTWLSGLLLTVAVVTPAFAADDAMTVAKRINDQWIAAYNNGDAAGMAKLYTSDAIFLPPEAQTPIKGTQGIENYYQEMIKAKLTNMAIPVTDAQMIDAKSVFAAGTWSSDMGQQHLSGLWMTLLQQEGSDWKFKADTWNMPPPPAPGSTASTNTTGSGTTAPKQ
jgi:uncharacterized protein (TIGR02246 family)